MPIEVITGLPRNGKTLLMVSELYAAAVAAKRPIFECGVDGLLPGLATPLRAEQWNAKNPDGSYIVPDGSLVFVDEAWKWFGHLRSARTLQTPDHVLDMAEHGHRGLDFVFTTQGPGQLYPFLRTLIQRHRHVVRVMGAEMAKVYEWPELNDDVKSASMREAALTTFWRYPKDAYTWYKSSSVHTVKFKLDRRVIVFGVLLVAIVALGYAGIHWFAASKKDAALSSLSSSSELGASGAPASAGFASLSVPTQAQQAAEAVRYSYQLQPRVIGQPWTAPLFDGRDVTAEPRILCVALGDGGRDGCTCYTEQATRMVGIDLDQCMVMALHGEPYNPYRQRPVADAVPSQPVGDAPPQAVVASDPVAVAAPGGGGGSVEPVASYGGFRQ